MPFFPGHCGMLLPYYRGFVVTRECYTQSNTTIGISSGVVTLDAGVNSYVFPAVGLCQSI